MVGRPLAPLRRNATPERRALAPDQSVTVVAPTEARAAADGPPSPLRDAIAPSMREV